MSTDDIYVGDVLFADVEKMIRYRVTSNEDNCRFFITHSDESGLIKCIVDSVDRHSPISKNIMVSFYDNFEQRCGKHVVLWVTPSVLLPAIHDSCALKEMFDEMGVSCD